MYSRTFGYAKMSTESKRPPLVNVQDPAPFFKGNAVVDGAVKEISLNDYKGKWLVLLFYPFNFTGVCNTELVVVNELWDKFKETGVEVVGISMDSVPCHQAWIKQPSAEGGLGPLHFPLLSDFSKKISRDYGVILPAKDCPMRATYLIDPKGMVRHITVNDLPVARSVDETLRTAQGFIHFEKNGEMCSCRWKPK